MSTNYFNLNNSLLIDLPPEKCDKKREMKFQDILEITILFSGDKRNSKRYNIFKFFKIFYIKFLRNNIQ